MTTSDSTKAETKAEPQKAAAAKAAPQTVTTGSRNVLTDNMPQPPGVKLRRRVRRADAKRRSGPFAKYVGSSVLRTIRPQDWKTLGIELDKEATTRTDSWSIKNDYLLETSLFTDEQLDYLFIDDTNKVTGAHEFLEVDYDENGDLVQVPYEEDEDDE